MKEFQMMLLVLILAGCNMKTKPASLREGPDKESGGLNRFIYCDWVHWNSMQPDKNFFSKNSLWVDLLNDTLKMNLNEVLEFKNEKFSKYDLKDRAGKIVFTSEYFRMNNGIYSELILTENDTIVHKDVIDFTVDSIQRLNAVISIEYISGFSIFHSKDFKCDSMIVKEFLRIPNKNLALPFNGDKNTKAYISQIYWNDGLGLIAVSIFNGQKKIIYFRR